MHYAGSGPAALVCDGHGSFKGKKWRKEMEAAYGYYRVMIPGKSEVDSPAIAGSSPLNAVECAWSMLKNEMRKFNVSDSNNVTVV